MTFQTNYLQCVFPLYPWFFLAGLKKQIYRFKNKNIHWTCIIFCFCLKTHLSFLLPKPIVNSNLLLHISYTLYIVKKITHYNRTVSSQCKGEKGRGFFAQNKSSPAVISCGTAFFRLFSSTIYFDFFSYL